MFADDSDQMRQNQDDETRGKDSKGKEVARNTTPPINFFAILKEFGIPPLDTSCPQKLRQQLYAGVFLRPNKLKYFVDEKSNKNCFVLYAKELSIIYSGHSEYWQWTNDKGISGEDIEVAELIDVCWLDIKGTIRTINLSPATKYEIVLILKKNKHFDSTFDLIIRLHHSKVVRRSHHIQNEPLKVWFEIQVGEFMLLPEYIGRMDFGLEQHDNFWKSGLVIKCAIIRPMKK